MTAIGTGTGVSRFRRPTSGFAGPDIPGAGLVLRLDAASGGSLFKDTAATQVATLDGDLVARWLDLTGGGRDGLQSVAGNRPVLKKALQNGRDLVRFDGTDDRLELGGSVSAAGDFSVFSVLRRNAGGGADSVFLGELGAINSYLGDFYAPDTRIYVSSATAATGTIGFYVPDQMGLYGFKRSGDQIEFRKDLARLGATRTFGGTLTLGMLGAINVSSWPWNGDFGEILAYNTHLSDADTADVENYLRTKWGTP